MKGMGGGYSYGKGITPTPDRNPSAGVYCWGWDNPTPESIVAMAALSVTVLDLLFLLAVRCSVLALLWPLCWPCFGPEWWLLGPIVALCWTCLVLFWPCVGHVSALLCPEWCRFGLVLGPLRLLMAKQSQLKVK